MKTVKELLSLWKHDVSWDKKNAHEKKACLEFGLAVSLVLLVSSSWLIVPAILLVSYTIKGLSDINVEE